MGRPRPKLVAAVLAVLALVVAWGLIGLAPLAPRQAFDQNLFHLKAIERFSAELPAADLRDYESATTPGYHLALAAVHRWLSDDVIDLRLVAAFFTVGLLAWLGRVVGGRCPPEMALAACLPVLASLYVLSSASALLPDNAAWLGVAVVLGLALHGTPGVLTLAAAGVALALLVLTRQIHLWAAAPLWVSAWLAWGSLPAPSQSLGLGPANSRSITPTLRRLELWPPEGEARSAAVRLGVALLATLPALLVLAYFVRLWGGLTPPAFQPGSGSPLFTKDATAVGGVNPATPAFTLAIIGVCASFFAPLLLSRTRRSLDGRAWRAMLVPGVLAAGAALVLAIVPATSYQLPERISGLWNLVRVTPVYADRSPVIIALATLGGFWAGCWFGALPRREGWILAAALAGFIAAHTASALAWQRYLEPGVLILLALATSRLPMNHHASRWALLGPLALAALLAAVSVVSWA
jgi:hypothetical protein